MRLSSGLRSAIARGPVAEEECRPWPRLRRVYILNVDPDWVDAQHELLERLRANVPDWGDRKDGLVMRGSDGRVVEVTEHNGVVNVKVIMKLKSDVIRSSPRSSYRPRGQHVAQTSVERCRSFAGLPADVAALADSRRGCSRDAVDSLALSAGLLPMRDQAFVLLGAAGVGHDGMLYSPHRRTMETTACRGRCITGARAPARSRRKPPAEIIQKSESYRANSTR